ncbi:hypothetical protein ACFSJ3_14355 [Corallincola platygyrae]|uniref:Uncharacterized protein n=1 Tax=Corallincola platygyrae TaxID=1193278 RepID=A0ABW4XTM7_9GAMM
MFSPSEKRLIQQILKAHLASATKELKKLNEDSDEYMEKANGLMVVDSLIAKLEREA